MSNIDITKVKTTRGGFRVHIYETLSGRIHGRMQCSDEWIIKSWRLNGAVLGGGLNDACDLIEEKTWRAWKEGEAPRFFMAKHKESAVCSIQLASRDGSNTSSYYFHLFNNYDRLHEDGTTTPCGVLDG